MFWDGLGNASAREKRSVSGAAILGVIKPALHRLARHVGVKRISALICEETRHTL